MKPLTLAHRLMARLKQEPGRVVPHADLYRAMWPDGAPERANEILREIATRVRRGLPPGYALIAIWGKGYVLRVSKVQR